MIVIQRHSESSSKTQLLRIWWNCPCHVPSSIFVYLLFLSYFCSSSSLLSLQGLPTRTSLTKRNSISQIKKRTLLCCFHCLNCMIPLVFTLFLRDGSPLSPLPDRLYTCSYAFIARNSSELSVQQGETLEVRKIIIILMKY